MATGLELEIWKLISAGLELEYAFEYLIDLCREPELKYLVWTLTYLL